MNPDLARLQPYPFERLARLLRGVQPPAGIEPVRMTIGEPSHAPPGFIVERLAASLAGVAGYPMTAGLPELRAACARWLERRYALGDGAVTEETMVLPVNGTREALFAFAQTVVDGARGAQVLLPNPCYQIYEGAALMAGAQPVYLAAADGPPDLDAVPAATWARCQLLFLCSPGNPNGAVMDLPYLCHAIELADRHGFVIASDECYAEIFDDEAAPPPGLLEASARLGRAGFERCVVFHSLSKRSSVPGLRSGFVAGDARLLEAFRLYRTYHGSAVPVHTQLASVAAWQEEEHVAANRRLYRAKFDAVLPRLAGALEVRRPAGAFYLWPRTPGDDEEFARALYAATGVSVLPGSYLGREVDGVNPGRGRVRISLVAPAGPCADAADRIRDFLQRG